MVIVCNIFKIIPILVINMKMIAKGNAIMRKIKLLWLTLDLGSEKSYSYRRN